MGLKFFQAAETRGTENAHFPNFTCQPHYSRWVYVALEIILKWPAPLPCMGAQLLFLLFFSIYVLCKCKLNSLWILILKQKFSPDTCVSNILNVFRTPASNVRWPWMLLKKSFKETHILEKFPDMSPSLLWWWLNFIGIIL